MDESRTFETGPIRPPSEAGSYLLRLTRNCPWNRCAFCRTYKGEAFSLRSSEEIEKDIDAMAMIRDRLLETGSAAGLECRIRGGPGAAQDRTGERYSRAAFKRRKSIEQDVVRLFRIGYQRRLHAGEGFYRKTRGAGRPIGQGERTPRGCIVFFYRD